MCGEATFTEKCRVRIRVRAMLDLCEACLELWSSVRNTESDTSLAAAETALYSHSAFR